MSVLLLLASCTCSQSLSGKVDTFEDTARARTLPIWPEKWMSLYHLLCGRKKMCFLQQWFNYSFCNRGHGCRKVLFASSIHRKEVWVSFQFLIFILTGIFIPFPCLFPSCMSSFWCLSFSGWVWIVLGHIFGLTSADAETNVDVVTAKHLQPVLWRGENWIWFYSFNVDFDVDIEKFHVWTLHFFSIGVVWSQAVGVFSAVKELRRRKKKRNTFSLSLKQPCRTPGLPWVMVLGLAAVSQLQHFLLYGLITDEELASVLPAGCCTGACSSCYLTQWVSLEVFLSAGITMCCLRCGNKWVGAALGIFVLQQK